MCLESSVCKLDKLMYFMGYAGLHAKKLLWEPYLSFQELKLPISIAQTVEKWEYSLFFDFV